MGDTARALVQLREAGVPRAQPSAKPRKCPGSLGEIHIQEGNVDGALAVWKDFLECAEGIRSVKARATAEEMRVRLARYQDLSQSSRLLASP